MGIIRTARTGASAARSLHRHRNKLRAGDERREGLALVAAEVGHEPLKLAAETMAVAGTARLVAAGVGAGTIAAGGATAVAAPVVAGVAAAYVAGKAADRVHERYSSGRGTVKGDLARVAVPGRKLVDGAKARFAPPITQQRALPAPAEA
jgi:hypothetical protein